VPNCKSFLVTEAERKHVRRRARFQQHRDASCHQVFFFLHDKAPKKIHEILKETLGDHVPSYTTVKNWVAQFERADLFTCDAPRPGRPKNSDHPVDYWSNSRANLEDRRISAKSIAEQLGISRERVGSMIYEDLDTRKLSAKWVPKSPNADQKRQWSQSSEQLSEFFRRDSNDFLSGAIVDHGRNLVISLWSGDKATINGVAAWRLTSPPKNTSSKFRWKSSCLDFFGDQDGILHIIFQRAKLSTRSITYLRRCKWRTFWRKNAAGRSPRVSCSCTTMPRLTGHLQHRRNWPTWASNVLITHPILRIWPRRTTTCFLDRKKQLEGRHFSSYADVIAAAETWLNGQPSEFFLSGLQKLEQRAKKCIEIRGEYVE